MRAVGCLGASFVWVGTGEPLMLAYMHQTTWVGKVEGGLGDVRVAGGLVGTVGASCVLWGASGRRLCGWLPVNHSCWRTCTKQHGWERWREGWDVRVAGS